MIKRKPDLLWVLAIVLLVGVIASSVLMESAPEGSSQVATGFAAATSQDRGLSSR